MKHIEQVREFHENFNHPINDNDLKHRQLRIKLIFEELKELSEATDTRKTFLDLCEETVTETYGIRVDFDNIKTDMIHQRIPSISDGDNVDVVETLDALCDIEYVLGGTIVQSGMQDVFNEGYDRVHASNMSKMCSNEKERDDTLKFYADKNIEVYAEQKGTGYIIKRSIDDKTLKNVYYNAVDLSDLIKK